MKKSNSVILIDHPEAGSTGFSESESPGSAALGSADLLKPGDWEALEAFLRLGTVAGTYFAGGKLPVSEALALLLRCLAQDGVRVADRAIAVSLEGRALRRDAAVFALAVVAARGDVAAKALVFANLGRVCGTGAELFDFVHRVRDLRGWGRGVRRAVAGWYRGRYSDELALQVLTHRRRCGWSHRDLLRLAHPVPATREQGAVFRWILRGERGLGERTVLRPLPTPDDSAACEGGLEGIGAWPRRFRARVYPPVGELPALIRGVERARNASKREEILSAIRELGLPWEAVPPRWLEDREVWRVLLQRMSVEDVLGNLGRISAAGLLVPGSAEVRRVEECLVDREQIRRAGVHPISVLLASRGYAEGGIERRGRRWEPVPSLLEALEKGFQVALENVEPVGRPVLVAIDLSRSMQVARVGGSRLSFLEAALAMALVTVSADPGSVVVGFTGAGSVVPGRVSWQGGVGLTLLEVFPGLRVSEALNRLPHLPLGRVDPAIPMNWALRHRLDVGGFLTLTDDLGPAGETSPGRALAEYRAARVARARGVVIRMAGGGGEPPTGGDPGIMEVSGFDALVPRVVSRFLRDGGVDRGSG